MWYRPAVKGVTRRARLRKRGATGMASWPPWVWPGEGQVDAAGGGGGEEGRVVGQQHDGRAGGAGAQGAVEVVAVGPGVVDAGEVEALAGAFEDRPALRSRRRPWRSSSRAKWSPSVK